MKIAAALPTRNSTALTGVVSTGSRVPCSRSPTTAYALSSAGTKTGISSGRNSEVSTRLSSTVLAAEALSARMDTVGLTRKTIGRTAAVTRMNRLRRNSASSLRMTAPIRVALMLIGSALRVVDQLEVDVLQRVPRFGDRQHVRPGGHQGPGDRGRGLGRI